MTVKELFKMVEKSNELKKLLNEKEITIELTIKPFNYFKIKNYTEYKKIIKEEIIEEAIEDFINPELIQDEKYLNYFKNEEIEIYIIY